MYLYLSNHQSQWHRYYTPFINNAIRFALLKHYTASYVTKFPYSYISPTIIIGTSMIGSWRKHRRTSSAHTPRPSVLVCSTRSDNRRSSPLSNTSPCIDRVFRNESLDATHLAEFHQIEGVVADYNLTLGDFIGVLNAF